MIGLRWVRQIAALCGTSVVDESSRKKAKRDNALFVVASALRVL